MPPPSFRGPSAAREPGIHNHRLGVWIPGSRLTARPGMTHESVRADQYRWLIGSSSAGNSVMTRQPLSVTTTSSSMRAAEKPSLAGQ